MPTSKVSITLETEVLEDARLQAGGNLSAFINEAVKKQLRKEFARQLLADRERELGPIPEKYEEWAKRFFGE
jgi:post-segregation antitoxin (ccd killing protein)